ncbi:MAG: hypothetical protein IJP59_05010 [Muribaculaceae bacterium]|nr:hypothetical protein [Muribaculaceae bacterium]
MRNACLIVMMLLGLSTISARPVILEDEVFQEIPSHLNFKKHQNIRKSARVVSNGVTRQKISKIKAEEATSQLDIILNFDSESQSAERIIFINSETEISNMDCGVYVLENGSNIMSVTQGVYDIITSFRILDPSNPGKILYKSYVIRENVSINADMQMTVSADEAKNHIHVQTLIANGEPVNTGKYTIDENWNVVPMEPGNVDDVFYHNMIACKDYGVIQSSIGNFGIVIESEFYNNPGNSATSDFYINDVSDRYVFYTHRVAVKGNEVYTSSVEIEGATDDTTVENEPSKYVLFEEPFCLSTFQSMDRYLVFAFFERSPLFDGIKGMMYEGVQPIGQGDKFKYYLSASIDDSNVGFIPLIQPEVAIKPMSDQLVPVLISMPLTISDGDILLANNGVGSYSAYPGPNFNGDLVDNVYFKYPEWPTHPVFSYPMENKQGDFGQNCPLLVTNVQLIGNIFGFNFDYIGRYGEKMRQLLSANIKLNGEDFYSAEEPFFAQLDSPLSGEVDIIVTDEMLTIDDLAGSNITRLHFVAGTEDSNPPTATMLHFKTVNGDVTDRFDTAADGMLEFSAGDFNFMLTSNQEEAYSRQAPASIEVSYSPYGENNWSELQVDEVPENYWPLMGWFYCGSLSGVTGYSQNGWFDIKIRLTDASGNLQEQVLSPAFRIGDVEMSITSVSDNNAKEVARYSVDGHRIIAPKPGINIVMMSDGTVYKQLVK